MRFDTETFIFKVDTDSGIEGLVLKNREEYHYGTSGIGLLHDLLEHPYKPIKNPYLDEIAALGAFNEFRLNEQGGDILTELEGVLDQGYEELNEVFRFKWNYKHIRELSIEVEYLVEKSLKHYKDTKYCEFINKYKYLINHYFELGANTFHNRFNDYFNSYNDLYYGLGDEVIHKLNPLVNTDLEYIKLTINYRTRETKVEY